MLQSIASNHEGWPVVRLSLGFTLKLSDCIAAAIGYEAFNELLPVQTGDKAQSWIIGTREQVIHLINEFYVKIAIDRVQFTPLIPVPFDREKYITVLKR